MQICNMFFYQVLTLAKSTSTPIFSSIRSKQKCICVYKNKTYDLIHLPRNIALVGGRGPETFVSLTRSLPNTRSNFVATNSD